MATKKEYHLFIYKGDKKKTYVYIAGGESLSFYEKKRIANQYFKTTIDNLEIENLYRLGKNLYDTHVYRSELTELVTRKSK